MKIDVITLFPELVEAVTQHGMPRVAVEKQVLTCSTVNPRDFSGNRHRNVDDRPFGGGPGMVMQAQPLAQTVAYCKQGNPAAKVIALSPQGAPLSQHWLAKLAQEEGLILVCGRYEGFDERFVEQEVDVELSLGDFVLSGGELGAMTLIDGIARLLPGVLGDAESAVSESFSQALLDHPHYSRPEIWRVPEVLLSGDHAKIARWRKKQAVKATLTKRPDLLQKMMETAKRADSEEVISLLHQWLESDTHD